MFYKRQEERIEFPDNSIAKAIIIEGGFIRKHRDVRMELQKCSERYRREAYTALMQLINQKLKKRPFKIEFHFHV